MRRYYYEIYLDDSLIDQSNCEYESEEEAESEANFAVNTYADCTDRSWWEFRVKVLTS